MTYDAEYYSDQERKRRRKDPEKYRRTLEEKKKQREREKEEDAVEKRKEEEAIRMEELKIIEESKESKRRKALEDQANSEFMPTDMFNTDDMPLKIKHSHNVNKTAEGFGIIEEEVEEQGEQPKSQPTLHVLDDQLSKTIMDIEKEVHNRYHKDEVSEIRPQEIVEKMENDESKKKEFEMLKSVYAIIPSKKKEIFKYPIKWELIEKHNIIETKIRQTVCNSIRELLGAEDDAVIDLIVKKVVRHCTPQDILDKIEEFLENDAEKFVIKLWRALIFEQIKLEMK